MRWHLFDKHVLAARVVILWVMSMIQQQFYSIVTVVKWDAPKSLLKREFLLYLLYQDSTVVFFIFSLFKLSFESILAQNSFVYLSLYFRSKLVLSIIFQPRHHPRPSGLRRLSQVQKPNQNRSERLPSSWESQGETINSA